MTVTVPTRVVLPSSCALCPRACSADRAAGETGYCGADDSLRVARAALHFWEEPPVSGSQGSGAVFFSNCPLRCVYCQNASIAHDGFGKELSLERLADVFLELQDAGAANINLVTGTHYLPWILPALDSARVRGLDLPIVWNTSGYETVACVSALENHVDVYLTDFKYWKAAESCSALRYSHASSYFEFARDALDAMLQQVGEPVFVYDGLIGKGVIVRHLLLPGCLEDSKRIMGYLWKRYGSAVLYSVMDQYTPMRRFSDFPELGLRTSKADYEELLCFMDELGMEDYFWQEGDPAQESFIPAFDATGL